MINIGVTSKGRLKKDILKIFKKKKLDIISERGERDLFAQIKNLSNIKIIYLHAREIIQRLGDNSIDLGFSGYDLLAESDAATQSKIQVIKKYNFGLCDLKIAVPDLWADVQTIADLEEVSFLFKEKKNKRLRVATKYPNLTKNFLYSKGITQFQLVKSLGSTEVAPFTNFSEIISEIVETGKTIKENNLRILSDSLILKSQGCLMMSKISSKKKGIRKIINLLSR